MRSWAAEPELRALLVEFGEDLDWTFVMAGLHREFPAEGMARQWMDATAGSGMPTDPRVWGKGPMKSSHPACMAVKAAAMQAGDGGYAYLRAVRERVFCFGRKLDTSEALAGVARDVGLDVERFRLDLASDAVRRLGPMASAEIAAVCDMPLLRAEAEVAALALEWRVRPLPVLAGRLWEAA